MSSPPLAILNTGLVAAVGLCTQSACAAMRARLSNPTETRFIGSGGEWIRAHQVPLSQNWRGIAKLIKMAAMAIEEALDGIPRSQWQSIPLLLCLSEPERPGRPAGMDERVFRGIEREVGVKFAAGSQVVARGKVSVAAALAQARDFIWQQHKPRVLLATTDSFLSWECLVHYEQHARLLSARNTNGFMPGEAGGALLVGRPGGQPQLLCTGLGFGFESAHIDSREPLRAAGLSTAMKAALDDADCALHQVDYRITDLNGEQYYFKEAALALSRTLRERKTEFDLWHPAESTGETGASAGASVVCLAQTASRKGYGHGPAVLAHFSNDAGQRAAMTLHFRAM